MGWFRVCVVFSIVVIPTNSFSKVREMLAGTQASVLLMLSVTVLSPAEPKLTTML